MDESDYKLKPCPFCGSQLLGIKEWANSFSVVCGNCSCEGPNGLDSKNAAELWNRRCAIGSIEDQQSDYDINKEAYEDWLWKSNE